LQRKISEKKKRVSLFAKKEGDNETSLEVVIAKYLPCPEKK